MGSPTCLNCPHQPRKTDWPSTNQVHGKTVSGFLNHFAGSGTFHRRPEVTVKYGILCTSLQDAMTNSGIQIEGFQGPSWRILNVMEKLEEQVYHDIGETALADFETLKGPIETRTALLKSCNVHMKDLIGAVAYLPNTRLPLRRLKEADLESVVGWTPKPEDHVDLSDRIDTIEIALNSILERLHAMQVFGELKNAKEDLKQAEVSKKKG